MHSVIRFLFCYSLIIVVLVSASRCLLLIPSRAFACRLQTHSLSAPSPPVYDYLATSHRFLILLRRFRSVCPPFFRHSSSYRPVFIAKMGRGAEDTVYKIPHTRIDIFLYSLNKTRSAHSGEAEEAGTSVRRVRHPATTAKTKTEPATSPVAWRARKPSGRRKRSIWLPIWVTGDEREKCLFFSFLFVSFYFFFPFLSPFKEKKCYK